MAYIRKNAIHALIHSRLHITYSASGKSLKLRDLILSRANGANAECTQNVQNEICL